MSSNDIKRYADHNHIQKMREDDLGEWVSYDDHRSAMDRLAAERDSAVADSKRWNELCRQVDLIMFPYTILDDAMAMGAGTLELYIDEAIKEQEQGK